MAPGRDAVKTLALAGTVAAFLAGLFGCSEQGEEPARVAAVGSKPIALQPFTNLAALKGKAPELLLADEIIGPRLRAILPQEQVACAKEIFNYMPDLELKPDGNLYAELNGSHADGWRHGLVNIQPAGQINLLLDCSFEDKGAQPYYLFTNRDIADKPDNSVTDWARDAIIDNANSILLSNGLDKRETTIAGILDKTAIAKPLAEQNDKPDVVANAVTAEPKNLPLVEKRQESTPQPPQATKTEPRQAVSYIRAGAIACKNPKSFFKVAAIERANNPYVSLPGDCETVPANIPTTFTRYISTPAGSDLIQAGTFAGTFYVRNYDIAY